MPLPLRALSGNVLGLRGRRLSSRAPAPGCGVSSVMWRSSRENRGQVTSLARPLPPSCRAESRAFPGSALGCLRYGRAPLRRGLCSAPRPEAVELSCWLIKAGCLGRPICSQVNCVAIFPFGRRTKTSHQFVQRMDGQSHVPVCIPSKLSRSHTGQHGVTLRLPCVGIKGGVTPSPRPHAERLQNIRSSCSASGSSVSSAFSDVSSGCSYMDASSP